MFFIYELYKIIVRNFIWIEIYVKIDDGKLNNMAKSYSNVVLLYLLVIYTYDDAICKEMNGLYALLDILFQF